MRRGKTYAWIPLWVDKWLWGSTRHELAHDERAIFTDLLSLAAKDDGWIRANPETPYPLEQLSGMLCAPTELLKRTILMCIKHSKLEEPIAGIYRIASWEGYQLTDRRKRDLSPIDEVISEIKEPVSDKPAKGICIVLSTVLSSSLKEKNFLTWWEKYPRKVEKTPAFEAYVSALKEATPDDLLKSLDGYLTEIAENKTEKKYIKHAATFLHKNRWRDYLERPARPLRVGETDQMDHDAAYWAEVCRLKSEGKTPEEITASMAGYEKKETP